ncbi:MAG: FapA family protein [Treponema sp.]|jgi:uncharacterized protein (DUF342 family)|nr:FapA family protein [Treponema sp.]
MVDFVQLQRRMKEQLDQDRAIQSVETAGPTIEAVVAEAATLLDVPVRRLEYEVLERGSAGFLGTGKKDWKIRAYQRIADQEDEEDEDLSFEEFEEEKKPVIEDKDGEVFVKLTSDGAMLKVTAPVGKGKRVTLPLAMKALNAKMVKEVPEDLAANVVKEMDGEYVRVGVFEHNIANDVSAQVDVVEQNMKAFIIIKAPGQGGFDITAEMILSLLKQNRVYFGIDEEFITNFADHPVYREPALVAEGLKAINGRDAYIQYNFENNQSKVKIREGANGRVNFKDLNIIQNVVESQPLAKKIVAEKGTPGKNLVGEPLPANNGKDIPLPTGRNVHVGEDGVTIIADMNGQVIVVGDKINVESVYQVNGNVDLKTGNIDFLGSVEISGNVEDGFFVKAAGNIEIRGLVERANLEAEGDITVHQGIAGKSSGRVKAGRSIWARFIENTNVEAGNMVVVSDGIVNSQVDAFKRIVVKGKRANVVGGHLRATEEISADSIGSPTSGTETICEVGYDLKAKLRHDDLTGKRTALEDELTVLQRDLQTLINIKKQRKVLPPEKEIEMKEMMEKRQGVMTSIKNLGNEIEKLELILSQDHGGRISAASKVYPGVRIFIRDVREDVRTEYKAVTFVLEEGLIRAAKYEEPEEDGLEMPNGNSAD